MKKISLFSITLLLFWVGGIFLLHPTSVYAQNQFIRGDLNQDGLVNDQDVFPPGWRVGPGNPSDYLPCLDAADTNDDGHLDISDEISLDLFLSGGRTMPPPYPRVGYDPTNDNLGCDNYPAEQFDWIEIISPEPEPNPDNPQFEYPQQITIQYELREAGWLEISTPTGGLGGRREPGIDQHTAALLPIGLNYIRFSLHTSSGEHLFKTVIYNVVRTSIHITSIEKNASGDEATLTFNLSGPSSQIRVYHQREFYFDSLVSLREHADAYTDENGFSDDLLGVIDNPEVGTLQFHISGLEQGRHRFYVATILPSSAYDYVDYTYYRHPFDADGNGQVDINDAVKILRCLFLNPLECPANN